MATKASKQAAQKPLRPAPKPSETRPTKAENDGLAKFLRQTTMLLSTEERIADAYRAGFRAGKATEVNRFNKLVAELTKAGNA